MSGLIDHPDLEAQHILDYRAILPYLPPLLVHEVLQAPAVPSVRSTSYSGSVLFLDIAGFSSMSEALSAQGHSGAEEMTDILNRYFTELLKTALQHGGQLIKFGGDAILMYFGGDNHTTRAASCALRMQEVMQDYAVVRTSRGNYPLTIRIGVDSGIFYAASVGRAGGKREYIFSGPDVRRAIKAEEVAPPRKVAVGSLTAMLLGPYASLVPREQDCSVLDRLIHPPPLAGMDEAPVLSDRVPSPEQAALLASYLPAPLIKRIISTQGSNLEMMGEHRLVSVMFVNFLDLDALLSQARATSQEAELLQEIHRYYSMVERAVSRFGGIINRCDPMLHGDKLLILFGAPISHENDAEHAVRCALELKANLPDLRVRIRHRIGISTGYVFSGNVGSPWHREYTVIGNTANLAARLMSAAQEGEILINASTAAGLEQQLMADPLAPIRVKGFSEPVQIYRVTGWRAMRKSQVGESRLPDALLARQAELVRLQGVLGGALNGRGQVIAITGPAGMGKSAMNSTLVHNWQQAGGDVCIGSCEAYGRSIPYLPWIDLLRGFFNLLPADAPEVQRRKIEQRVSDLSPIWLDRLQVLTRLLEIPDIEGLWSPVVEQGSRAWQQQIHDFITTLFRMQAAARPLMIVIADLHWVDQASLALVRHMVHNIDDHPLVLLLSYRSGGEVQPLDSLEHPYTEVVLGELPPTACRDLICKILSCPEISDKLADQLWTWSHGNPFYLKELLHYLQPRGYLVPDSTGCYTLEGDTRNIPIPDSIERIIISAIDQLDESRRQALKFAAVIGQHFAVRVLQALYAPMSEPLSTALDRLDSQNFIRLDQPLPNPAYAFCESQVQEVTYATLSFAQRRYLHCQLGYFFEQELVNQLSEPYALLAYHFDLGQEVDKAFKYHVRAADRARETYANHESLYHYRRSLELLPQLSSAPDPQSLVELYRNQGRVCRFLGCYGEAKESYEQGLRLARHTNDVAGEAASLIWLCDLDYLQGNTSQALEKASQAANLAQRASNKALLELSLEYVGGACMTRGALDSAFLYFTRCLILSNELRNTPGKLRSLNNIGLIRTAQGHFGQAISVFSEALQVARKLRDYFYMIILADNLGELHQQLFDTAKALPLHEEAHTLAQQFGVRDFECDSLRNMGVDLAQSGDFARALDALKRAHEMAHEAGLAISEATILYNLGEVHVISGALGEAAALTDELFALVNRPGLASLQQKAYWLSGLIYKARGQLPEAQTAIQHSLDLGEHGPPGPHDIERYLALGEVYREQGRFELAQAAFTQARQIVARIVDSINDSNLQNTFLQSSLVRKMLLLQQC